ncbi:Ig domain-containing protein [Shewanella sp. Actino-trap-3]|uniref:Ig-like domain-containing protein n=1 Tax=Shewanella sp. Actino-trap-3 TaxID=2058331 RepID=UPI000C343787|nr:Ig-like domain-containing protein [Shewanella sp. Actino-trap-3]PKG78374.1 Ig domain-containing protein [Shewanella sp. Actino-trap-3]
MNIFKKKASLLFTMLLGVFLLAGCNNDDNNDTNNDNGAVLSSIAITPANSSLPAGLKQQFTAIGTYSDGTSSDISSSATWSSDDSAIATINGSGLAIGVIPGSAAITASISSSDVQSATTTLTVTDATLNSLAITPANPSIANGLTKQFIATGTYSDGTSPDVTASVTWSSANTQVATVNESGLASGVAIGSALITASLGSEETTTELTITDAILSSIALTPVDPSIANGLTQQLTATATYSDGISVDITASATWLSADTDVATVNDSGLASALATGTSVVTATFDAKSATSTLTVTDAMLSSIALTPVDSSIANGLTEQFTATGTYSDGTSVDITASVTWSSADTSVATVVSSGIARGIATGSSVITATSGAISATSVLTVTDATLSSITVTPANPSIPKDQTQQLKATGVFSDGTSTDITASAEWSSANTSVATVNTNGLASGVASGTSDISATSGATSGSTTLTVTNATLSSLVVSPATPSVIKGMSKQFAATGTYSDDSVHDVSTEVTWSSTDLLVATIDTNGLATGIDAGTSLITATLDTITDDSNLTVINATLDSITVTPSDPTISNGNTKQFTATGTYSDTSEINITSSVTWSSADTLVATMNANGKSNSGLASGVDVGTSVISATLDGNSAETTLTVKAALLDNPLAPELGEVARFAILASQAITTTSGSAIVDGDLAILDQARSYYAGFTPVTPVEEHAGEFAELTNGLSYAGDDSTPPYVVPVPYASMVAFINQSRTDLGIAYSFLAKDPNPNAATQVLPIELGNLTMTRGVYKTASNVTIQTGTLTLDAQGEPDSVFIFTIGGDLTTGAPGGDIVLSNGAQAKNVYWRTAGKTVIGTGTSFAGNVFAWSKVNVLTNAIVTGRLMAVTEEVTLDSNDITKKP